MFSGCWRTLTEVPPPGPSRTRQVDRFLKGVPTSSRDHRGRSPDGGSAQARRGGTLPDVLRPSHDLHRRRRHHDHALPGRGGGGRGGEGRPPHPPAGLGQEAGGERHRGQPPELLGGAGRRRPVPGPLPPVPAPHLPAEGSPGLLHHPWRGAVRLHPRASGYSAVVCVTRSRRRRFSLSSAVVPPVRRSVPARRHQRDPGGRSGLGPRGPEAGLRAGARLSAGQDAERQRPEAARGEVLGGGEGGGGEAASSPVPQLRGRTGLLLHQGTLKSRRSC